MGIHSDPTANAAIGAVSREWKQMVRKAILIRGTNRDLMPEEKRLFTGVYRQFLTEPLNVLEERKERGKY